MIHYTSIKVLIENTKSPIVAKSDLICRSDSRRCIKIPVVCIHIFLEKIYILLLDGRAGKLCWLD